MFSAPVPSPLPPIPPPPFIPAPPPPLRSESQVCTGYSPLLSFTVEDMDAAVPRLLGLGATLDGPVRHHLYGAVAAVRSPDGHMVGLVEGADLPGGGGEAIAAAAAAAREGV